MSWDTILARINRHPRNDPAWVSQCRSLNLIIERAQEWEIEPGPYRSISISNWSAIIRQAKLAIQANRKRALIALFNKAASLTCQDLRIQLGQGSTEVINVLASEGAFNLVVTSAQFDRIRRNTKARHVYRVLGAERSSR